MAWQPLPNQSSPSQRRRADSSGGSSTHEFALGVGPSASTPRRKRRSSASQTHIQLSPSETDFAVAYDESVGVPREVDSGDDAGESETVDELDGVVSRFSTISDASAPVITSHRRKHSVASSASDSLLIHPGRKVSEPLRTRCVRIACWWLLLSILVCMPFMCITVFNSLRFLITTRTPSSFISPLIGSSSRRSDAITVPVVNLLAIPTFCILLAVVFVDIAFVAYLTLAQTDPPEGAQLPFLPWDLKLIWRVDVVVFRWLGVAVRVIPGIVVDWSVRKVLSAQNKDTKWGRYNVHYGSTRPGKRLDVYRAARLSPDDPSSAYPQLDLLKQQQLDAIIRLRSRHPSPNSDSSQSNNVFALPSNNSTGPSPVIIFIYSPHLGPIRGQKWMYESLGRNLAALGYAVVIPDLTYYPEGRAKQMVQDVRRVMNWTLENIKKYGGDVNRIYVMGHSLGAHLALLTVLQEAVVISREGVLAQDGDAGDMSNGLRKLQIYSSEVRIPKVQGLILLAPICDVNDQIVHEAHRGVSHLSKLRRILGPSHTTAMFHSPTHVLHASRNVVNVALLPPKILFIHGGLDEEVPHSQSEMMKEMLRGVGMADVRCRVYPVGHVDVVTAMMMKMNDSCSTAVLDELTSFIPL